MKKQIETLMSTFTIQLQEISRLPDGLGRLNAVNKLSDKMILSIRQLLLNKKFENDEEEIEFFKVIHPGFLSASIEEGLKYYIRMNTPISTNESLITYFEDALKTLQSFFTMNNFHYQYFRNNFTELDGIYFLRDAAALTIPIVDIPPQKKDFCTPMSYLFAKFLAYENVQRYILTQIRELGTSGTALTGYRTAADGPELQWTGEAINIVELAYGLWLTGQLNHGNASLNQIVRWLEKNLSVSIGIAQRKFSEISRRKRISPTKFMEHMKDAILRKIDSGCQ